MANGAERCESLETRFLIICLNSKFLFNLTLFFKEGSLNFEPAMSRTFLIHGLAHGSL